MTEGSAAPEGDSLNLHEGMVAAGMSVEQVWLNQLSVGGDAGSLEVEAYLLGLLVPDSYHHDLLAQAINETFIEQGGDHPVAYFDHEDSTPPQA